MASKIKVDTIEENTSGGSVSLNSSLKLKQYTTSQVDALSGMNTGDMVYDTEAKAIKVYNGTNWASIDVGDAWTATGGSVTETVGGYKYHYFHSSGNLTISGSGSKNCDVYVIGGGGAGATSSSQNHTRGGGGGGMAYKVLTLSAGTHAVTVGAGGDQV